MNKPAITRSQISTKVEYLRKQSCVDYPSNLPIKELLNYLFDIGGKISGGAVLSVINNKPIKDVDVYFNDEISYVKAFHASQHMKCIDVCWYFDSPYEMHDISYVQCIMDRNGITMSDVAKRSIESGVSELYINKVIYPDRTADRMLKYNTKYNVKFKLQQVLAFSSIFNIDRSVVDKLISISV